MKRLGLLLGTVMALVGLLGWVPVASAYASPGLSTISGVADTAKNEVCAGIGLAGNGCGDSGVQVSKALSAAITLLSVIVGIVAVIMVIIAGLKFVTSGGDANKVASAKNAIIYAIIGLVVVAASQMLVHFVFNQVK